MRKVGIKQLRSNLGKELKDLPFAIESRGKIVAKVYTPDEEKPEPKPKKEKVYTSETVDSFLKGSRRVRDLSKGTQAAGRMGSQ